jgi:lysozyme
MSYRDIVKAQLRVDEGVRLKVYRDSLGIETIGVGRNIRDKGLSMPEVDFLLENDLTDAERDARSLFPTFDKLSDVRKAVLINMSFNMGRERLSKFKKLRAAVQDEDWAEAARQMILSTWAAQVGARATRLAKQMEVS